MLDITLNRHSKLPLYRQIAEQIKTQISNGRLPANTRLPTVRQLAADLGITRLTVQNAYGELQSGGWVEATVGRGTFVSSSVQPIRLTPTIGQYLTPDSAINDMLALNQVIGVRSMAMAHADPALFPVDEFWACLNQLRPLAQDLLGYGPIQGDTELRVEISNLLHEGSIDTVPEDIIVTVGAMQAISLVVQVLGQPGDAVLVDQPTYIGILNILQAQDLQPIPLPLDPEGPDLAAMERLIRAHRPRFYYAIPNFHNPTGICITAERRQAMLALAHQYDMFILEDDLYGWLAYDHPPPPPLKAMDEHNRIIYLSSFSKVLMPGLRVGFVVVPPALRTQLLMLRRATDLCGPGLLHRALAVFLRQGGLKRHLRRVLPIYRERRDTLLTALNRFMPATVTWSRPAGGYCCWVTLPRTFAPGQLYRTALQNGFAFTPGEAYQIESQTDEFFRLCFGNLNSDGIQACVKLIGELIHNQAVQQQQPSAWIPVV